ncbi:CHAT domain-containing tetratricopeptide repeat protein [Roseateles sp. LYH14W]|uniref:CHAT domain-containing protein n=1 Tax=Pelomonas parva TaxID=3299032 RepID=A0ABW7F9T0_9BURK
MNLWTPALLSLLTVLASPAAAQPTTLAALCPPALEPMPAGLDPAAAQARLLDLQDRADPASLALACQLRDRAAAEHGPGSRVAQQAQAGVLASLLALRQPAPVLALGPDLYRQLLAQTPPLFAPAGQVAGLLATVHNQRDEFDAALAWSDKALAAQQADPAASDAIDPRMRWTERINHGIYLNQLRRYDAAEQELRALHQALQGRDDLAAQQAFVLRGLTVNAQALGRRDEVLSLAEQEVALRRARLPDDRLRLAGALQGVAAMLTFKARFEEADAIYQQALSLPRADDPDPFHQMAGIYENYASLCLARGKPAEALQAAQAAATRIAQSPEAGSPRAARSLRRMASAQQALGDWGASVQTSRRALALLKQSGQSADQQTSLALHLGYGRALVVLGDAQAAQAELELARLELARAGNPAGQRLHWLLLQASVLAATQDLAGSEQALADAAELMSKIYPPEHDLRLGTQAKRCQLNPAQCAALAPWLGLSPAQPPLSPDTEADVALALARDARLAGQAPLARSRATRALAAAYASTLPNLQWQALDELAQGEATQGRRADAIVYAKQAVLTLQQMRAGLAPLGSGAAAADSGFMQNKQELYRRLAAWLLHEQRLAEGLQVLQLLKLGEQDDFLERAGTASLGELSLTPGEQARLADLTRFVQAQASAATPEQARLRRLQSADRLSASEKAELAAWRQSEATRLAALQQALAQLLTATPPTTTARAAPMALPRPTQAHVMHAHLVLGEQQLSVLTLGPHSQRLDRLPLSRAAVHQAIAAFLDAIQRRAEVRPQAQALYAQLGAALDAAARRQGATRIQLWLDGGLRYLPFGALHDGQRYLAQKYQLALVAPVGPRLASAPAGAPTRLLALGLSQAAAGMPALPGVGEELCGIVSGPVRGLSEPAPGCLPSAAAMQGSGPIGGQADLNQFFTEKSLSDISPAGGNLLHIGTHFILRPGNVTRSALLLGDGQALSLARLRTLPAMAPQRLVVLSACQSGVPVLGADGVELDGLAASWMARGAERVLASLWRVDDRTTAPFMRRFYQALAARPGDYGAALRAAQGQQTDSHPYFWAAFNLIERSP